jgi:hypothetical protein
MWVILLAIHLPPFSFSLIKNKIIQCFTCIVCNVYNIHTYYKVYIQEHVFYGQCKRFLRAILANAMLGFHGVLGT